MTPQELLTKAAHVKTTEPRLRARELATRLGVSECELLAARVGQGVTRLKLDLATLLPGLEACGDVMALTRNENAVSEKTGTYRKAEVGQAHALVLDEEIDLRVFPSRWVHGYAVEEETLKSLQFFDAAGTAVHKIYVRDHTRLDAWAALQKQLEHPAQEQSVTVSPAPPPPPEKEATPGAIADLAAQWTAMKDTHEFFGILKRLGLSRRQALRLGPPGFVWRVQLDALTTTLEAASASGLPIMIFIGNPGCIQIHTGPVKKIVRTGPWINVLDERFNLHLREDLIAEAYVVTKPTVDGAVRSLELLDANGELIAQVFGARKPGKPELAEWTALALKLPSTPVATPSA